MSGSRWTWRLLALPGVAWLSIFFLVALYAVLAVAFGNQDTLSQPVPFWNPLDWNVGYVLDMLKKREVSLIVNSVEEDRRSIEDSWSIRNTALQNRITYYTTLSGARAACLGMQHIEEMRAYDIQSLHASLP